MIEEKSKELQECQKKENLKSCYQCPKMENCQIRLDYVNSVYQSMNKGNKNSNFEFDY
jgi:hypothetical protein